MTALHGVLIAQHMGGIPETAMVLGPVLLIAAFVRIARRNEAATDDDDWDAELGDLPEPDDQELEPVRSGGRGSAS